MTNRTEHDRTHSVRSHLDGERRDLVDALVTHRALLRRCADGLTDEQAALRSTVSALTIGGLVKHVAQVEQAWAQFVVDGTLGPTAAWTEVDWSNPDPALFERYAEGFRMLPGETLAGLLATYAEIASATDELVATIPDLDVAHPLPAAPWFEPGASRSARRAFIHIVAETAQHAGHADIIRETIDGARSMG